MLNIRRCLDPDVMVSDLPSVLVVSQYGIVYPKKVHANAFVSPGIVFAISQQGKTPPEDLWKMHAEQQFSVHQICIFIPRSEYLKIALLCSIYNNYIIMLAQ